jgi:hypothetical protein
MTVKVEGKPRPQPKLRIWNQDLRKTCAYEPGAK